MIVERSCIHQLSLLYPFRLRCLRTCVDCPHHITVHGCVKSRPSSPLSVTPLWGNCAAIRFDWDHLRQGQKGMMPCGRPDMLAFVASAVIGRPSKNTDCSPLGLSQTASRWIEWSNRFDGHPSKHLCRLQMADSSSSEHPWRVLFARSKHRVILRNSRGIPCFNYAGDGAR